MESDTLDKAILKTLAYFSIFGYPLTSFEVWKWLMVDGGTKTSLPQVISRLETSPTINRHVSEHQGFYALGDTRSQVAERQERFHDATRKFSKLRRFMKLLARLPWIEGVAVCNSLAWRHTTNESDIDLFILTTQGRTWSARLFATLPLKLFRARPGETTHDPICLSFFIAPSAADLSKVKIAEHDPYLSYWCQSLVPLLERANWFHKFGEANNWVKQVLPNSFSYRMAWRFRPKSAWRLVRWPLSEKLARTLQLERLPKVIKEMMNRDSRVVVQDDMLKFHHNDARLQITRQLQEKLIMLGI